MLARSLSLASFLPTPSLVLALLDSALPATSRSTTSNGMKERIIECALPTSRRQQILLGDTFYVQSRHRVTQAPGDLSDDLGILVVSGRLDNGLGPDGGIAGLEDAGANEDAFCPQLHHERRIGRSGYSAGSEVDHWELACPLDLQQ